MKFLRKIYPAMFFMALLQLHAQNSVENDTIKIESKCNMKQFIIPAVLITYGTISLNSSNLHKVDAQIKEDVQKKKHIDLMIICCLYQQLRYTH
jgi:hypothetical protein